MALRYYANAPATALAASCTSGQTSIEVDAVTGLPITYPYTLIIDRGEATEEAVSVTNASGTTLTVTRGYDSTTAFAHSVGAEVVHGITAADPREANLHVNSTDSVHGVTGDVVGTSDTQTLTGKTVDLTDNTVTGTTAEFNTALSDNNFATQAGAETLSNKTLTGVEVSSGSFDTAVAGAVPIGAMLPYAAATAPNANWLVCNGAAVSRTTYADLFAAIGTTFGVGDGSTTFNLPNTAASFLLGENSAGGFDMGETGGNQTTTLTTTQLPNHLHAVGTLATANDGTHNHDLTTRTASTAGGAAPMAGSVAGGSGNDVSSIQNDGLHNHTITGSTATTGSGAAFSNMPPFLVTQFIIRAL